MFTSKTGFMMRPPKRVAELWRAEVRAKARRIPADLLCNGYDGAWSTELRLSVECLTDLEPPQTRLQSYLNFGWRAMQLVDEIKC